MEPSRTCVIRDWEAAILRAGRLTLRIAVALVTAFVYGNVLQGAPSVVYVDVSYRTNGSVVTFPNFGGTGSYRVGSNAFNSIQAGVTNVAGGGTVYVAAGVY